MSAGEADGFDTRALYRAQRDLRVQVRRRDGVLCWERPPARSEHRGPARPRDPRESPQHLIDLAEEQEAAAWARSRGLPVLFAEDPPGLAQAG